MAEGNRSFQAFWMGGGASAEAVVAGGNRSLQNFWMGGGASATAIMSGGKRSFHAFWMGGAGNSGVAIEEIIAGAGYPVKAKKYVRPKGIGEFLDVAMEEIYVAAITSDVPRETKLKFVEVIKEDAKGKSEIPDVSEVNWDNIRGNVAKIDKILELWQQLLIEEDMILMAYVQYYH